MAKPNAKQSYLYTGPVTPLEDDGRERMLFPGTSYSDLPLESEVVQNLIARDLLVVEETSTAPATSVATSTEGA